MKPRISVITIGVADLEKSLLFYRDGLGLPTEGIVGREFEHGAVAFFELSGGLRLAIWAQNDIAHDTGMPQGPTSPTAFTIGHNVTRREEVDEVIEQARRAGGDTVKTPEDTFYGGYAGYFRDPNGHLWEVVWNPANAVDSALANVEHINPEGMHKSPVFSQGIVVPAEARTLIIGGQNGVDETGNVVGNGLVGQAAKAIDNLVNVLETAGGTLDDLVRVGLYIKGEGDITPGFNEWMRRAGQIRNPPTVTVMRVLGLAMPDFLIEIEATAVLR